MYGIQTNSILINLNIMAHKRLHDIMAIFGVAGCILQFVFPKGNITLDVARILRLWNHDKNKAMFWEVVSDCLEKASGYQQKAYLLQRYESKICEVTARLTPLPPACDLTTWQKQALSDLFDMHSGFCRTLIDLVMGQPALQSVATLARLLASVGVKYCCVTTAEQVATCNRLVSDQMFVRVHTALLMNLMNMDQLMLLALLTVPENSFDVSFNWVGQCPIIPLVLAETGVFAKLSFNKDMTANLEYSSRSGIFVVTGTTCQTFDPEKHEETKCRQCWDLMHLLLCRAYGVPCHY